MTDIRPFIVDDPLVAAAAAGLDIHQRTGTAPPSSNGTSSTETLDIRWVVDAVTDPPPAPEILIDGLLRAGELCVVGAPRAIGKSWLAMNIACLAGRGQGHLFGRLPIKRKARVLLAQGEVDPWESARRWQMLTGSQGPPPNVAETFTRWRIRAMTQRSAVRDKDIVYTDEWVDAQLDERLEHAIETNRIDILIIDPWAVYYAGTENSNDQTEAALDKLRDLAMRHHVALVILHHVGKGSDVREPEDLWRGASRLADWASTRVTLLPHYTIKQAEAQGMTRQQARRYCDLFFLRRSTPTDDFSIVLNTENGWWEHWQTPEQASLSQRINMNPVDVADACRATGGIWGSARIAAETLGVSPTTAGRLLDEAVRTGYLELVPTTSDSPRPRRRYRVPETTLYDQIEDDPF